MLHIEVSKFDADACKEDRQVYRSAKLIEHVIQLAGLCKRCVSMSHIAQRVGQSIKLDRCEWSRASCTPNQFLLLGCQFTILALVDR